jgi:threonine dehydratase
MIIVPIGGGSGASGACIVAKSINPDIQVIGVQSEQAPAVYLSWKEGKIVEASMRSHAEGLATGSGYQTTLDILTKYLDDFVIVSDDDMDRAVILHLENTHNLTEHAGAASLAAAVKIKDRLAGKKVVLIMSGGNLSIQHLKEALEKHA